MSERTVFVNGEYVPESRATISVFDHVVLYGDGVFETAVAWRGTIFKLEAHLDRLHRSLQAINLTPPHSRTELTEIIVETVRRNELEDAYIKCLVTRGSNGLPFLDPEGCKPGCIVFVRPYLYMAGTEQRERGLRVKTTAVRRPTADVIDPRVKSLNYLNLVLAKLESKSAHADEALLLDSQGNVCEAPGYNVFCVREGVLRTPERDILAGITRETVIGLASDAGYDVRIENFSLYEAYTADEVFFCSTAGGILPVIEVDGRVIGSGDPGPVYMEMRDGYLDLLASGEHGTPIRPVVAN